MSDQKYAKVLIAGGSVAGLTLANILEQLGIDYPVLEKYGKIAPDVGASIGMFPNGFRILDQLGCYDAIKGLVEGADAFQTLNMRNEHGQVVLEVKDASKKFNERLGYESIFVDRQMIIQILYDNLRDKSKVLTKMGVTKVEQITGGVLVTTDDGNTFRGDVLVGADGIHSTKLPDVTRGLYDKIPRFADEQRDALAAEHANDLVSDTLTFGELYSTRTTANLQALPEVVFKKWHYNRIITIGDAAHKFNPIGGQGGNSAIEDAAVLADRLHKVISTSNMTSLTDAQISQALAETQRIRFPRATKFLKTSHDNQSMQAQDTFISKLIARYILPLSGPEKIVKIICEGARGAARINALPMPKRPHSELWDDEQTPSVGGDWKRVWYLVATGTTVLSVLAASGAQLKPASLSGLLLSITGKA
ncbi:hypothetical protein E8E11_000876 [Didymella keratinophila]|nr:hypothetical protein E8E11_000876 [Didymella keratinophila]